MKKLLPAIAILAIAFVTVGCSHASETEYQNGQYGFSLRYPTEHWVIDDNISPSIEGRNIEVKLISKKTQKRLEETGGYETATADIFVRVYDSVTFLPSSTTSTTDLREWMAKEFSNRSFALVEEITFAGVPAFAALAGSIDAADREIYIEHNGIIYVIEHERTNEDDPQNKEAEKIIETFQFIQ